MSEATLGDLTMALSYAEYQSEIHYRSHRARGTSGRDCVACAEHDEAVAQAEAALHEFLDAAERVA